MLGQYSNSENINLICATLMKMYNNSSIMIQSKVLNSLSVNKKELKSFI